MPELARGEWEHLFEPWFANETPFPSNAAVAERERDSLFREASQPLAVSRKDYIRRQSPLSRSLEERTANVAEAFDRLVTFAERRHVGVEGTERHAHVAPAQGQDVDRPKPTRSIETTTPDQPEVAVPDLEPANGARPIPSAILGPFRALLAFISIAAIALYVVYVQRSAAMAMSRAAAAERTATEVQRTAHDAVTAAADRAQHALADALTQATRAERMIEVIAAPDARRIGLSGRDSAPGALGQALYSRSRGVILSATDMPRPLEGHVFQVWATTPTGSVSLGTATPDAQGRLAAAYDVPPNAAGSVRSFLVTQEPVSGSTSPGVPVLASR